MRRLAPLALLLWTASALAQPPSSTPEPKAPFAKSELEKRAQTIPQPSSIRSLSVTVKQGQARVVAEAFIAASPEAALRTLSDFEGHPRFIPALLASRVSDRNGDSFRLDQTSRVKAGPFSQSIRSIKRVTIDKARLSIISRSLPESPSESQSSVKLSPSPAGCVMRYEASAKTPGWAPSALSESLARAQALEQLEALLSEIDRQSAAPASP